MADPATGAAYGLDPASTDGGTLIVGRGARFQGLLTFSGTAVVEGELRGEVVGRGTLILGETAYVEARIEVDQLICRGTAHGEIRARERIELIGSARVSGEIWTPRLGVADGCVVEAQCHTGKLPEASDSKSE